MLTPEVVGYIAVFFAFAFAVVPGIALLIVFFDWIDRRSG
jgi:hypothetical protein